MILLLGVFKPEIQPLIDEMQILETGELLNRSFCRGVIGENEIVVTSGFIGKIDTTMICQKFIDHFDPDKIILISGAGAIAPDLKIGDIIVGTSFVEHDKKLPVNQTKINSNLEAAVIFKKIKKDIPNVKFGTIISGDSLISDVNLKESLYNKYGALCVDMDSAAVAVTSDANKINFYVIKVILDLCDENASKDYNNNFEKCCLTGAELFIDILKNSKL